jgi:hypothetical protein
MTYWEQHLSREEFLKVAHILARGPGGTKEEGGGVSYEPMCRY